MEMNALWLRGAKEVSDNGRITFMHTLLSAIARLVVAPHDTRAIKLVWCNDTPIFVGTAVSPDSKCRKTSMSRRWKTIAALLGNKQVLEKVSVSALAVVELLRAVKLLGCE